MNIFPNYLLCSIPVVFIILSVIYKVKVYRLKDTGKIPYIIGAKQREILFFLLAVLSALIIIIE